MRQLYISALFSFFSLFTYGQQKEIDSLISIFNKSKSDIKKLQILSKLNPILNDFKNPKESSIYFNKMRDLSLKTKNDTLLLQSYLFLSQSAIKENNYKNAETYAKKSIKSIDSIKYEKSFVKGLIQLGRVYDHFKDYERAINTYKRGLNYSNITSSLNGTILLNIGVTYSRMEDYDNAVKYYLLGAEDSDKSKNYDDKSYALYQLGYLYLNLEQFKKAEEYFLKSLSDTLKMKNISRAYFNFRPLGVTYSRWGKYEKAINFNRKALHYYRKNGAKLYEFDVLNNTAIIYARLKKHDTAIVYANMALEIAYEINHKQAIVGSKHTLATAYIESGNFTTGEKYLFEIVKDSSDTKLFSNFEKAIINEHLSLIYEHKGEDKKALKYLKRYIEINEKLLKDQRDSNIADLETKYQTQKKEKELAQQKIATQEQELLTQKANTRNLFLAIGLLALGICAFFVWRRYKSEARAKQIISKQKRQIEKLQKEFHHRLKNDFRSINSYIGLVQRQFSDATFRERLNELRNRVTSMFKVHEILLQEDDITQVKAHPYLLELTQNVEDKYSNENIKVICNVDKTETIMADKAIPFGIVLNEFVTNSYKYAFDEQGGEINIDFNSDTDNHYLTLKDNGKGLPNDFNIENLSSLGMSIIPMFANLHDGSYQLDGTNGVSLTLILPKRVA